MKNDFCELFKFYYEFLKPAYSLVSAKNNILPVEILNEIHAAFDHLNRAYNNSEAPDACSVDAKGHLV